MFGVVAVEIFPHSHTHTRARAQFATAWLVKCLGNMYKHRPQQNNKHTTPTLAPNQLCTTISPRLRPTCKDTNSKQLAFARRFFSYTHPPMTFLASVSCLRKTHLLNCLRLLLLHASARLTVPPVSVYVSPPDLFVSYLTDACCVFRVSVINCPTLCMLQHDTLSLHPSHSLLPTCPSLLPRPHLLQFGRISIILSFPSTNISVSLSVSLSVCLTVCLSFCLSHYLPLSHSSRPCVTVTQSFPHTTQPLDTLVFPYPNLLQSLSLSFFPSHTHPTLTHSHTHTHTHLILSPVHPPIYVFLTTLYPYCLLSRNSTTKHNRNPSTRASSLQHVQTLRDNLPSICFPHTRVSTALPPNHAFTHTTDVLTRPHACPTHPSIRSSTALVKLRTSPPLFYVLYYCR